ncbi:MAG: prolyl oligopeptidase family serine peptidase [Steroidobacterales bacterium]
MQHFNHELRRSALTLLLIGLGCGPLHAQQAHSPLERDGVVAPDPAVSASLARYLESRSASFVDWLLDGSMLIATRFGDSDQIHRLRAPLGMREQLTYAPGGVSAGAARPYASDAFAYLAPLHGGEGSQLMLQRLADHALTTLTDGDQRDAAPLWAHDGRRIAFASNRRNGIDDDIYVLDTAEAGATPRLVVGGAGNHWRAYDWSSDDKRLLVGRELPGGELLVGSGAAGSKPESEIYIAQVDSGKITAVSFAAAAAVGAAHAGGSRRKQAQKTSAAADAIHVQDALFATDGRGILLLTRQTAPGTAATSATTAQFQRLAYVDIDGHNWRELSTDASHEVERFDRSADGHYVGYAINDAGGSRLVLIDQQRKLDLKVAAVPPGIIRAMKFDPDGKRLALTIESIRSPRDVYVLEPETQLLTRWTQSEVGPLDPDAFVAPQLLRYPTWDRIDGQARELSALVYRPAAAASGPRPVLVLLCGGGGGQCRPQFDPFLQWVVEELGVVVVAPNVRGSSGLGRGLEDAGRGALRDDTARDIGSLLVWIDLQRDLDRNRVALLGEGYGAFLALQSLADYGDRLRGGVVAFAPQLAGLANGTAIRRPVLLVQGLNNPGVPAYGLEQLRSRLRVDGVETQYLAAAEEGQGFTRKSNRDAYLDAAANFLAQLLR